jgi:hypothetical protein
MTERAGSGIIALRLKPDLDARLRAAGGSNVSEYVRDAIEAKLASDTGTTAKPASKRATGKCEHGQATGAFCRRCNGLVP